MLHIAVERYGELIVNNSIISTFFLGDLIGLFPNVDNRF